MIHEWIGNSKEKAFHDLVRRTFELGIKETASRLNVHEGFVLSWMPRRLSSGKLESGWEPSAGFISAAMAKLGYMAL